MKNLLMFCLMVVAAIIFSTVAFAAPSVIIKTNMGNIEIELNQQQAPISTENFLSYIDSGFYKNTIFHRVIPNFMIQGGGFTANLSRKATQGSIKNEADNGLKNQRGTIAMARTSAVNSATSQFFINLVDNYSLDHKSKIASKYGYAVFGKVVKGMDVVDKIAAVATGHKKRMSNVPYSPVIIQAIERIKVKE